MMYVMFDCGPGHIIHHLIKSFAIIYHLSHLPQSEPSFSTSIPPSTSTLSQSCHPWPSAVPSCPHPTPFLWQAGFPIPVRHMGLLNEATRGSLADTRGSLSDHPCACGRGHDHDRDKMPL